MKTTTTRRRRRRRPTTPLMKAFLLGLGFGATLTTTLTTLTMALETEYDVCHVNYFHKVCIILGFLFVSLSLSCDVAADWRDDIALF